MPLFSLISSTSTISHLTPLYISMLFIPLFFVLVLFILSEDDSMHFLLFFTTCEASSIKN